jgi:hypothetical protein
MEEYKLKTEATSKRQIEGYRIAPQVVAVAVEGAVKDWACYVAVSDGVTRRQLQIAAGIGCKQPESVARALFPDAPWTRLRYRL